MDFGRIISDSWRIMRTTKALWWLGLISAVQISLYALIVGGMIAPMAVLTQLMVTVRQGSEAGAGTDTAQLSAAVTTAGLWLSANWPALLTGASALVLAWGVAGVYDVAATAGLITQAEASAQGRPASASTGLRDGFHVWWRTVGLLAVAALPSLIYMVAIGLVTLFAVSLPLYQGALPNPAALRTGTALSQPLSLLVSIVSIPLGILVALGLRFAVLRGFEWRESLAHAWDLAKHRLTDVGLMYLIVIGIGTAISLVGMIPSIVLFVVFAIVAAVTIGASHGAVSATLVVIGCIFAILVLVLFLVVMVATIMWQSVAWTVFWRQITGVEPACQPSVAPSYVASDPQPIGGDAR